MVEVEQAMKNWEGKKIAAAPTLFQFAFPTYWGQMPFCPTVDAMHAVTIMSLEAMGQLVGLGTGTVLTRREVRWFSPNCGRIIGSEVIEKWEGKDLFSPPSIEIWRSIRPLPYSLLHR